MENQQNLQRKKHCIIIFIIYRGPFASGSSMIFKEALSKIHYPSYNFDDLQ